MQPGCVLALGIDLTDLERIAASYERFGEKFALKICTPSEWKYCSKHADPIPSLAARFAAKEALSKALGTGIGADCELLDIEVSSDERGAPKLSLSGAAKITAENMGIRDWKISLTHSKLSAAATVIGLS